MIATVIRVLYILLTLSAFIVGFFGKDTKKQLIYACTVLGIEIVGFLVYTFIK